MCLSFETFRLKSGGFLPFFLTFFLKRVRVCVLILTWPVSIHQSVRVCVWEIRKHRTQRLLCSQWRCTFLFCCRLPFLFPQRSTELQHLCQHPFPPWCPLLPFSPVFLLVLDYCTILEELLGGECCREGLERCLFKRDQPAQGTLLSAATAQLLWLATVRFCSWVRDSFI